MNTMEENPLLEIRRIKEEISSECQGDMRQLDESLLQIENRLRAQGRMFAGASASAQYDSKPPASMTLREDPPTP